MRYVPAFLFSLLVFQSPLHAETAVVRLGPGEPLPVDLYGFNCDLVAATAFEGITFGGPEMEKAARDLRPIALRFPGGSTANNYLWKVDGYSEAKGDLTGWAGKLIAHFRRIGRPYDLPGYARLCRQFDLHPVWVLNIYEETPESLAEMLAHLDGLGLQLDAVELANEPYWDPRSLNDVQRYIALCKPLVEVLRKERPELKVGACFAPLVNEPFDYREKWNALLAKEVWYDAIVFHDYYGGQGFALEAGAKLPAKALLHPDAFIDESVKELTALLPGKPIWLTEWNIGSEGIKEWKDTGAELLFLGAVTTRIIAHRDVIERSLFHQLYEDGFGTFHRNKESGGVTTSASYEFFRLLGAAFAGAESAHTAEFGNEALLGFATGAMDGARLFVVHRGPEAVTLRLPEEMTGSLARLTIECPPETKLPVPSRPAGRHAVEGREITLPPFSISLVAAPTALEAPAEPAPGDNLFPARPLLSLWYPPFAAEQPQVDASGSYALDFSGLKDKEMAVVKMDLTGLGLEAGKTYALSFEAMSATGHGLTVNLPERTVSGGSEPKGTWSALTADFHPLRFVFPFDPTINKGEVTFFFDRETVAVGARYGFQNFRFVPAR